MRVGLDVAGRSRLGALRLEIIDQGFNLFGLSVIFASLPAWLCPRLCSASPLPRPAGAAGWLLPSGRLKDEWLIAWRRQKIDSWRIHFRDDLPTNDEMIPIGCGLPGFTGCAEPAFSAVMT